MTRLPETETGLELSNDLKHFLLSLTLPSRYHDDSLFVLKMLKLSWGCNYVPCLSGNGSQETLYLQTGPSGPGPHRLPSHHQPSQTSWALPCRTSLTNWKAMLCYGRLRALPIDHNSSHSKIENDYSVVYVLRSVAIVMQYLPLQQQVVKSETID